MQPCVQEKNIWVLQANQENMAKDLAEIKGDVKWLSVKFDELLDKLENKFVLRSEFKVALAVLSAISVVLWIIVYFSDK